MKMDSAASRKSSDCLTVNNRIRMTKIERVIKETVSVRTFYFKDKLCAEGKPGQFVMIWIPGVDEIPMSISSSSPDGQLSITVAKVGDATAALHGSRRGSLIGVRGPFGSSFEITEGRTLLIGGGTGIAPLTFLVKKLIDLKVEPTIHWERGQLQISFSFRR